MRRTAALAALGALWIACAGVLVAIGGSGWTTRAILVIGVLAAIAAFQSR